MYQFYIRICICLTLALLAVVGFYVVAFNSYKHVPYRIGLTACLLPFILYMFFPLLSMWKWDNPHYGRNISDYLPYMKLFIRSWKAENALVSILLYFAIWGVLAFVISLIIKFLIKVIKQ